MDSQSTTVPLSKPAWGKWEKDKQPEHYHCLEHHCADVAACFEGLIQDPVLHNRFERAMGGRQFCAVTRARLTVIAFLHDFGKLNAGFQFKVRERDKLPSNPPPHSGHIREAGFFCQRRELCEDLGLHELLSEWGYGVDSLLRAALSHHGRPPVFQENAGPTEIWQPFGGYDPRASAALLRQRVRAWFPDAFQQGPCLPEAGEAPALAHLFAGIVALADHIGSHEEAFPMEPHPDPDYIKKARARAQEILHERGFCRAARPNQAKPIDFPEMFEHTDLRPLQQAVADASLDHPLLILEGETGSGKTEAAIIRFAQLWRAGLVDGLYFALPTRAAARQLHRRVNKALVKLFSGSMDIETVLAIPGYILAGDKKGEKGKAIGDFEVTWEDEVKQAQKEARWAAESALHFLSATAAVGTIDQALLGSLKVKWAHLRGASLARSLLVVDEVHASDEYMNELLCSLLRDHLTIGGHAMLMSATLGAEARIKLGSCTVSSRCDIPPAEETEKTPYPVITLAGNGSGKQQLIEVKGSSAPKQVRMQIKECMGSASQIAELAYSYAQQGAKVLVIRNTVNSAQMVFKELLNHGRDELLFKVNNVPALHHSRFAAEDRKLLDDMLETALGKERQDDGGLIVVGTQTLEQSLDIDADLLITDLCPVDVLLQRVGRLHRHRGRERPANFSEPQCIVLTPENGLEEGLEGKLLKHGLGASERGGGVYPNLLIIRQTQQLIEKHPEWRIPAMNRMLVEQATHPDILRDQAQNLGDQWKSDESRTYGRQAAWGNAAKNHCLDRRESYDEKLQFPAKDMKIRTRLGEDGFRIELEACQRGPFGQGVQTFNLPPHLFRYGKDAPEDAVGNVRTEPTGDGLHPGLRLYAGDHTFLYDCTGISAISGE